MKGLPFNRYSWLVTHNSFSILGEPSRTGVERVTFYNQEDSVTNQLRVGSGLMTKLFLGPLFISDVCVCVIKQFVMVLFAEWCQGIDA